MSKKQQKFVPTVVKTEMNGDEGYLVSNSDLIQTLKIPAGFYVVDIHDGGEVVEFKLVEKALVITKDGVMRYPEKAMAYTARPKDVLFPLLGMECDHFIPWGMIRGAGQVLHRIDRFPNVEIIINQNKLYWWFQKDDYWRKCTLQLDLHKR